MFNATWQDVVIALGFTLIVGGVFSYGCHVVNETERECLRRNTAVDCWRMRGGR